MILTMDSNSLYEEFATLSLYHLAENFVRGGVGAMNFPNHADEYIWYNHDDNLWYEKCTVYSARFDRCHSGIITSRAFFSAAIAFRREARTNQI